MNIQNLKKELQNKTDSLGKKIDPGIFDTVLYLALHKFNTVSSCEGHLDRGLAFPWIDFSSLNSHTTSDELNKKRDTIQKLLVETDNDYNHVEVLNAKRETDEIITEISKENSEMIMNLIATINEFYKGRDSNADSRLIITDLATTFRLHSQGGILQKTRTKADREKYLGIYQKEMNDFTNFLKDK